MKKITILLIIGVLSFMKLSAQNCFADYSYNTDSTGLVNFQAQIQTAGNTLCSSNWNFGDGTSSSELNPSHQYTSSGSYTVCLIIETSSNADCSTIDCVDSACYQIDINIAVVCNLNLSYTQTNVSVYGGADGAIDLTVTNGASPYNYVWSSGQNTEDISNLTAGDYSVTVSDSAACQDSLTITITEPTLPPVYSLSGQVFAKTALLPEGIALLIDAQNKVLDKTDIINGEYQFLNIDSGQYTVNAIPYFDLAYAYYPIYFPTYIGDEVNWQNSSLILVDSIRMDDVHLKYYSEILHGQAFVSGFVNYEEDSGFEDAIYQQNWFSNFNKSPNNHAAPNVTVFLKDENAQIVDFCLTNNLGKYQFDKIPYGVYSIYVEKSGKNTFPVVLYLSNEKDSLENINLTIQAHEIVSVPKVHPSEQKFSIYPNPFTDEIRIELSEINKKYSITIFDLTGREVLAQQITKEKNTIHTNKLEKGIYILYCKSTKYKVFTKKIIKN